MRKRDQPHDRFYKDCMHHLEVVRKFLEVYLDKEIQEAIDWSTLAPYDTSLIGEKGKQLYADVLYRALTKQGAEVFLIFNHERKPDELLLIRMSEYGSGTLKRSIKQKQGKPAFIVSFTLYNGSKHPYPYPKDILDYYEDRELARKLLLSGHRIIDLSDYSDEELANHGPLSAMELFMKHIDNPDLLEWIRKNRSIIKELESSSYLDRSIDYLIEAGNYEVEELLTLFEEVSPKIKEEMLSTRQQIERDVLKRASSKFKEELKTTKQQIERQAIKQGRQEGLQQGIQQVAKSLLSQLHLDLKAVQQATGLSQEELERLQKE